MTRRKKMMMGGLIPVPKRMYAKGKKKDWVDKVFGKTTKKEKKIIKGVVYTAGALALVGASGEVVRRL